MMQKQRKYSQLKQQERAFEQTNNKTDLTSLPDLEFKKEVLQMIKKLRKRIDRNTNHCKKELEIIKRSQSN